MQRTFKYRLYPNRKQRQILATQLDLCRELYNAGLQERIESYKTNRKGVTWLQQQSQLPAIKKIRPEFKTDIHSHTLQAVLIRLDRSFQNFFRRVKVGQTPGFPRFKSKRRFNSLVFTPEAFKVEGSRVKLSKVGSIKIKMHRPLLENHGTLFLKQACGAWYACFSCKVETQRLPLSPLEVGIDMGLESFAVLSDGTKIENPCWYRTAQAKLRVAQRRVARRIKGSHRRYKAVMILQKIHKHIANQRKDFQDKLSFKLIQKYGIIAIEALNIKGLAGSMLAKSVHDAGWSQFLNMLAYKAEQAGRTLIAVNPAGTSQTCTCGAAVRKKLSDREHVCPECGLIANRDHVSAQIILQWARIVPLGANVDEAMSCVA
jgi:putative transposase